MPIVPGIMPVTNLRQVQRFAELSGAAVPAEVADRLEPVRDDPAALRAEGVQVAIELCDALLSGGAPGLHYYTLNRSTATREIHAALGSPGSDPEESFSSPERRISGCVGRIRARGGRSWST